MLREPVNQYVGERAAGNQHDNPRPVVDIPVAHLLLPFAERPTRGSLVVAALNANSGPNYLGQIPDEDIDGAAAGG